MAFGVFQILSFITGINPVTEREVERHCKCHMNELIWKFQLGSTTVVPLTQSVLQLSATVLIPLCVGRLLGGLRPSPRPSPGPSAAQSISSVVGQLALLLIIYTTFCDAFYEHDMALSAMDVLLTVVFGKCYGVPQPLRFVDLLSIIILHTVNPPLFLLVEFPSIHMSNSVIRCVPRLN